MKRPFLRLTFLHLVSFFAFALHGSASLANTGSEKNLDALRTTYLAAVDAWESGNEAMYRQLKPKLTQYPLYSYLVYNEIKKDLNNLPFGQVDQFFTQEKSSYLADALRNRFLSALAGQSNWQKYTRYFDDSVSRDDLNCWHVWAKYQLGDKSILKEAGTLWNTGNSMPDACNPLFDRWRQQGGLTPELAWQRHKAAVTNRKAGLAKYLDRYLPKKTQALSQLFRNVSKDPSKLNNKTQFATGDKQKLADIVLYGLHKYAYKAPSSTLDLLNYYQKKLSLTRAQTQPILIRLTTGLIWQKNSRKAAQVYEQYKLPNDPTLIGIFIRNHLKTQQWQEVANWIEKFDNEEQKKESWQYWLARSVEQGAKISINGLKPDPKAIYAELSKERSYYGFLAADKVKQNYSLAHRPVEPTKEFLTTLQNNNPGIVRARELFALGKVANARAEWYDSTDAFTVEELTASALLATQWGWHRQAIETMAQAKYWDDVNIRFPVVYEDKFQQAAKKIDRPAILLMAIARQESALLDDAISPAGAMGLMQVMPATARETAKKAGIELSNKDELLVPAKNIEIASHYVDGLLKQFNNNRVLAIAAYNAGPHRVNTWLKRSQYKLDHDVWVEVIPFNETRSYVKNVLAYSVIYSRQTGKPAPMMTVAELSKSL